MPIGPAFLHRPLPVFTVNSFAQGVRWLIEGLAILAPRQLRERGFHPAYLLKSLDGHNSQTAVIEESWLGERRRTTIDSQPDKLPVAIALRTEDVFETTVNLPAAAAADLREAIAHRLHSISPLPADQIVFAMGKTRRLGIDRIEIPVAIARKALIDEVLISHASDRVLEIGSRADERGRFSYVLFRRNFSSSRARILVLSILPLIGFLSFFVGLDAQIERRITAVSTHEDALREALRIENEAVRFLADLPTSYSIGFTPIEIVRDLDLMNSMLPATAWLEEATVSHNGIAVKGFAPQNAEWPKDATPSLASVDRPGVVRFTLAYSRSDIP